MIFIEPTMPVSSFQPASEWRNEAANKRKEQPSSSRRCHIRNVAIVEDELMVALTVESFLEDLGLDVVGLFANGESAIAALDEIAVDLVCMDINLGRGIDGIEAARRIRAHQQSAIVFISAYSDASTRARVTELVPDAVLLGKPTSLAELDSVLSDLNRLGS